MNAVAAAYGAAEGARAEVSMLLDRMPARAGANRILLDHAAGAVAAAGASPASAAIGGFAMLAGDLRLDNAGELRRALGLAPDAADADIALEAFARWGDSFAHHLYGDFAFSILDLRAGRLLAVRDALGIRPLFYRADRGRVRCASEVRALVEPGDVIDEGYLGEMAAGDAVDIEGTPFAAIRRVPAAHVLIAAAGGPTLRRYWEPSREQHTGSIADHAARFRDEFDAAVMRQCAGALRVGVHLSGGLDSSSILGSICDNGFAAAVPASLIFPWPEADEREWTRLAARRWSIEPILVAPPVDPSANDLHHIATYKDLPDNPAGVPLMIPLHAALRERGVSVVLTGHGGDQWWAGDMAYMSDLLRAGRFAALNQWRAAGPALGEEIEWSWRSFARNGMLPIVPPALRRAVRRVVPSSIPEWIDPGFAKRIDLRERLRRRPGAEGAPSEAWARMRWRLDSGEEAWSKEKLDRTAAVTGVELRHPFYDRRLVELAFATPESARVGPRWNRVAMREAMKSRLPPEIASRVTKADMTSVLVSATRAHEVAASLEAAALVERGWVNRGAVAGLAASVIGGRNVFGAAPLWRLIGVEAWLNAGFGAR
jgi:asparagine synthase (glutamine-hydrolysing)